MKYLLVILLIVFPTLAIAQEEGVVPLTDCTAVLAAPPFVDILTRNEGRDFHDLSPLSSGRELLGLECSVDELSAFFEDAGWEFLDFRERSLGGPLGGHGGIPEYYVDAVADFCLKRPTFFGIIDFRCRPMVTILFYKGEISNLIVIMSK